MLFLALIAAQLADLFTFLCAVNVLGIGMEANPIVRWTYGHWGGWGVVALKGLTTFTFLPFLIFAQHPWPTVGVAIAVVILLFAALTNTLGVLVLR